MSALGFSFGSDFGSSPLPSFNGGTVFANNGGLTPQERVPAVNAWDSGDTVNLAGVLSNAALGWFKTVQQGNLQSDLIASGQSGTVVTSPNGTTQLATGAGVLNGTSLFGSSSGTILGLPILVWVIGAVVLFALKR